MNPHLKTTETLGHAIRRVCRGHVDQALASLRVAKLPDAVHDARKAIKKLRAVFRLARGGLSRADYRKLARAMRLAAKPLAAARDARVKQVAFETVAGRHSRQFPNVRAALALNSRKAEQRFRDEDLAAVSAFILQKLRRQLKGLSFACSGWDALAPRLEKSYRRCQCGFEQAREKPLPQNLHEWRKEVKYFWCQLDFLCPNWPKKTKALVAGLDHLAEQLGDDHDLVLLKEFVAEHCADTGETTALYRLIDERRTNLAAAIHALGAKLFAADKKTVSAQLKRDWKAWRDANAQC